jgi:hypothetical protein
MAREFSPSKVAPRDRVRIVTSALTGLTGTVFALASPFHCVLQIDGWADGAQVLIGTRALKRVGRRLFHDRTCSPTPSSISSSLPH